MKIFSGIHLIIRSLVVTVLTIAVCGRAVAEVQDIDKELSDLAERLAIPIKDHGMKKIAVIDFTDLQGQSSGELGKYIAEQLTVNLVMGKREFSILDRANLKSILAEHKLTATGLIDPDTAKKLGMFAGVDALVLGTVIPKSQKVSLTAKIITTETAEIIGAARAEFQLDETVHALISKPNTDTSPGSSADDAAKVTKKLGDLNVGLQSLHILNGREYTLTLTLSNQSQKKPIWVAVRGGMFGNSYPIITGPNGTEFLNRGVSGIPATLYQNNGFAEATEIAPGNSIPVTMKFSPSYSSSVPSTGQCTIQMEFLLGYNFGGGFGNCIIKNLVAKMDAE
jgi:TolB-like protein